MIEEINFDGLVGPTHNYAGLAFGNLAATKNEGLIAKPRAAALQGIAKMRALAKLGLPQGVLPPQERPSLSLLRALGFSGSDADMWESAWRTAPRLALAATSASSMWAANAATVSPSADCADGRLHATPANLLTMLHRSIEHPETARALRRLMADNERFAVHDALPAHAAFADEGAANHMRLSAGGQGVEIFVYGRDAGEAREGFPARQTREAGEAVARRHALDPARTVYVRQAKAAIDAGAFHNDVVAVSHDAVLFHHEHAFEDRDQTYADIRKAAEGLFNPVFVEVADADVPLADAVSSYLFNAQLVRLPGAARLTLIAPTEARENNRTAGYIAKLISFAESPIGAVEFADVRESMQNGGGPACLRLRIAMTKEERAASTRGFYLTPALADALEAWVRAHYRETLALDDLRDPRFIDETRAALDALTAILPLGADFYPFQRG